MPYNKNRPDYNELMRKGTKRSNALYFRMKTESPETILLWRTRANSKIRNIECSISVEDIVIPERCPILDIELGPIGGKNRNNSPSLDRVDNSTGYVRGNVRVISNRANTLKGEMSINDVERLLTYMKAKHGDK